MKKICQLLLTIFFTLTIFQNTVQAMDNLSIDDLPFAGYYLAPEGYGVEGLLFENNQLRIYINDDSRYSHGSSYHQHDHSDHDHSHDDHSHDDHSHETVPDQAFIERLFELNSFPHPDLENYTPQVREVYLEENDLPYDLVSVYQEIISQITPEMSQSDIIELINRSIPGIYYTEREGFNYFILAKPTVNQLNDQWTISLFGNELFQLSVDGTDLIDSQGTHYQYVDGVKPNE